MSTPANAPFVSSYFTLRQSLGIMSMLFPLALFFGGLLTMGEVMPSISDYYFSPMRDLVVSALVVFGIFLAASREDGPDAIQPNLIGFMACAGAVGVALFPNQPPTAGMQSFVHTFLDPKLCIMLHFASALMFLFALAAFCLCRFTRRADVRERRFHQYCGKTIIAAGIIATIASFGRLFNWPGMAHHVEALNVIFWLETIGVWAFCLSWMVKGRAEMARAAYQS